MLDVLQFLQFSLPDRNSNIESKNSIKNFKVDLSVCEPAQLKPVHLNPFLLINDFKFNSSLDKKDVRGQHDSPKLHDFQCSGSRSWWNHLLKEGVEYCSDDVTW